MDASRVGSNAWARRSGEGALGHNGDPSPADPRFGIASRCLSLSACSSARAAGGTIRLGAGFCNSCGAALATTAASREVRKTVTVLFCDLTGSTALGESDRSGGAARAAGALLRSDEGDHRVARRHGGEVHRRCGDGGVRHPRGARGRRLAGVSRGGGDAGCAARARDPRSDRREHGRGGDGDAGAACDRGRGQRRRAIRAGCSAG